MKTLATILLLVIGLNVLADPPFSIQPVQTNSVGVTFSVVVAAPAATNYSAINGTNYFPDTVVVLQATHTMTNWNVFEVTPVAPGVQPQTGLHIQPWNSGDVLITALYSNSVAHISSGLAPVITNNVGAQPLITWPYLAPTWCKTATY